MRNSHDYIVNQATKTAARWTVREVLAFHYFNKNGVIAARRPLDNAIDVLVEAGRLKSGSIYAHGGLDDYATRELVKLYDKTSAGLRVTRREVAVLVRMAEARNEKTVAFIAERAPEYLGAQFAQFEIDEKIEEIKARYPQVADRAACAAQNATESLISCEGYDADLAAVDRSEKWLGYFEASLEGLAEEVAA